MDIKLPKGYILEYIADGRTPIRALTDIAVSKLSHYLNGEGDIIELGASSDYYSKYFSVDKRYVVTNLTGTHIQIDMTSMKFKHNSIHYLTSFYALEHVFNYNAFFKEVYRVLIPGGRCMLALPFIYPFHAAPDDYFRFSVSMLRRVFKKFMILEIIPLGNREINIAEFLMEKSWHPYQKSAFSRFLLRLLALPFLLVGMSKASDQIFAGAFICVVEKPE